MDSSLEDGLHTLATDSTPMGLPMRKSLKTLWNEVFHRALDDFLVDPSASNGWLWVFVLPKLALHSSNEYELSDLNTLWLLLDEDLLPLRSDFIYSCSQIASLHALLYLPDDNGRVALSYSPIEAAYATV